MSKNMIPTTISRKQQTSWLIILTAMTLMPSYALQGWLASGHNATELPFAFWVAETLAWSLRALIEAAAILFLFQTITQTKQQAYLLWGFKVALIALITLTLGPVVASTGLGLPLPQALPTPLFWLWSFAVASYAPLMLGAVGVAYRIMPFDQADMVEPILTTEPPLETVPQPVEAEPIDKASFGLLQEAPPTEPIDQTEPPPPKVIDKASVTLQRTDEPTPRPEWDYHRITLTEAQHVYWMLKNDHQLSDNRIAELMGCSRNTLSKKIKGQPVYTNGHTNGNGGY